MMKHPYVLFLLMGILSIGQLSAQDLLPYVDVCHTGIYKHIYSFKQHGYSPWEYFDHECKGNFAEKMVKKFALVPKHTVTDFESMAVGNARLLFTEVTCIEKEYFRPKKVDRMEEGLETIACIIGISSTRELPIMNEMNYFEFFTNYIKYLRHFERKAHTIDANAYHYEMLRTDTQLDSIIDTPGRLGVLVNVKGGHTLGNSFYIEEEMTNTKEFKDYIMDNLDRMKGVKPLVEGFDYTLDFPVFSLALASVFGNGIVGQAYGMTMGTKDSYVVEDDFESSGVTPFGRKVIQRMLDNSEGNRILVNVHMMNVNSRKWYYNYVESQQKKGDTIPIFVNHAAISPLSWKDKDYAKSTTEVMSGDYINHREKDMAKEDVLAIYKSGGMIGISLDAMNLSGMKSVKALRQAVPGSQQARELELKIIMLHMFNIVKHVRERGGWDIISIGSDIGSINVPFSSYSNPKAFPDLAEDMLEFFKEPTDLFDQFTQSEVETLMFDFGPQELVNKVMSENGIGFIKRYFARNHPASLVDMK